VDYSKHHDFVVQQLEKHGVWKPRQYGSSYFVMDARVRQWSLANIGNCGVDSGEKFHAKPCLALLIPVSRFE
jgi:hypothetical protein